MLRACSLLLFLFATLAPSLFAGDVAQNLRTDYIGNVRLIRGFYQDSLLRYDSAGNMTHHGQPGSWTTSFISIKSLDITPAGVEIRGVRAVDVFDHKKRHFVRYLTTTPIQIKIDTGASAVEDQIRKALEAVFIGLREPLAPLLPDYWQWVITHLDANGNLPATPKDGTKSCPTDPSLESPCHVDGTEVKPPKPVHTPDPGYDEFARRSKFQGTSILKTVIDENGQCQRIRLTEPLGFGLDEHAVDAISHWKFQPGKRDGHVVPVEINVSINFRLY